MKASMHFNDRKHIDSVKGVLMLLVVLGHSVFAYEYNCFQTIVYSFHVYAFLLLPFMFSRKQISRDNMLDLTARYLVPYFVIVFLFSILYGVLHSYSPQKWLWYYIRGVMTGNDVYLKASCGFYYFWFLPVIFVVNLLLQTYSLVRIPGKTLLLLLFISAHLLLPAMSWPQKQYYPFFGTHIALYVMPVGLMFGFLTRKMTFEYCRKIRFMCFAFVMLLITFMFIHHSSLSLAHLTCPSFRRPVLVLVHDLVPMCALLTLLGFSRELTRLRYLPFIGQKSLYIYLFSQPVIVSVRLLYTKYLGIDSTVDIVTCGTISVIAGVLSGLAVAVFFERFPRARSVLFAR